jgi:hypothetical protein
MTELSTAGAKCAADISSLLRARNPLIWCVTREEARAERIILDAATAASYVPMWWDCATGITNLDGVLDAAAGDPAVALASIRDSGRRQVWIMRDLHAWLRDPTVTRALRSLCRSLPQAPREQARAVIIVSPSAEVPPELSGHAIVIDIPLPDRAEIAQLLDVAISSLPDEIRDKAAPNGTRDAAIDAALGLSAEEAQSTFARSLITTRTIDPATVASEKRRVIARERVLEWFDPLPAGLDGVGGLEQLKVWLIQRRSAFTPKARAYGLQAPKGVLLVGVPGCGKSLSAKAIATAWGMPLLRLDLGALRSKWVGESEANIRKALKVAETVAPAILWLDEMEKAIGGAAQGAADGGVSQDALGAVLSWMQDRAGSVFVVATANDVSKLPPELLRKGRLPDRERAEVHPPGGAARARPQRHRDRRRPRGRGNARLHRRRAGRHGPRGDVHRVRGQRATDHHRGPAGRRRHHRAPRQDVRRKDHRAAAVGRRPRPPGQHAGVPSFRQRVHPDPRPLTHH